MQCNYCGKPTVADSYGEYCEECLAYMDDEPVEHEPFDWPMNGVGPGQDAILSLNISPHQHDDELPRSLERFHLDDDTGPEQPYIGENGR